MDSNESAYGPSDAAREAARGAMDFVERYPDDASFTLAEAIARRFSLDPKRICCGFGSDDLLARPARIYLRPGDELIYPVHGYQKFPNYAHANDAIPVAAPDRNFTADVDNIVDMLTARTRVVMLANPDNPTGTWVSGRDVRRLHRALPDDVLLVLDSAYAEYVRAETYELPDALVEASGNVVMTRTFSKVFGLAGLRVGWMYAPEPIVDMVQRTGITFPLSAPALAGARRRWRMSITPGTWWKGTRASALHSPTASPRSESPCFQARPISFSPGSPAAPTRPLNAWRWLLGAGVIARRFAAADFQDCVRFTIGTEEEMARTAELLEAWAS
ncbi:MAG: aminotransferase class I/II-fold pyridoxal phosphate-dependent enzyme [Gammaproteobacteria bacterium]|nr:aminotransferase class I/II-fold pyridoxal phosphate-dependent enzyme [Gammaproteobacteria bacterium]